MIQERYIQGLNSERCAERNAVTALRHPDVEPVRVKLSAVGRSVSDGVIASLGRLPETDEELLRRVRSCQPDGAVPLGLDDIHAVQMEAASGVYLPDRYAFLAPSTLQNIASDGEDPGAAFMNSHRTGSFSTDSELPFGRTCAGRYEEYFDAEGRLQARSLLTVYMLRDVKPNGANGPSTDDLHRMISGGTLFDVSVGISRGATGQLMCNVCDRDVASRDCPHYPGTSIEMTDEERARAVAMGVPDGRATYRVERFRLSEVSGVYDGAVHNAGFRKLLAGARSDGESFVNHAEEIRHAYSSLLGDEGDFSRFVRAAGGGARIMSWLTRRRGGNHSPVNPLAAVSHEAYGHEREVDLDPGARAILDACAELEIETPEQLQQLSREAGWGRQALAEARERCGKEAVRAFGADGAKELKAGIEAMDLASAKAAGQAYARIADAKFGIDGEDGKEGGTRETAPAATAGQERFAKESEAKESSKTASLNPGDIYERRRGTRAGKKEA